MALIEKGFVGGAYLKEMYSGQSLSIFIRRKPIVPIKPDSVCDELVVYLKTGKMPINKDTVFYIDESTHNG